MVYALVCTVLDEGVFLTLIKRIESRDISPLFTATHPLEDILLHSKSF
jgi:hypothetical protein